MKQLLIIILILTGLITTAQNGVVRLEFEAAANNDIYKLIPLENRGLLVFFETKDFADEKSKNWFFTFYDIYFKEVWKTNIPVLEDAEYQDFQYQDSILYLFFQNPGKVKPDAENFQLLTLDLAKGQSFETTGNLPSESTFTRFIVSGDRLFLGMNLKNEQAGVYAIDLNSGPIKEYRLAYADQNFIEDLAYDTANHVLICTASNYLSRRQNKMYLISLDRDVNPIYEMEISPVITGKYLNTSRIYVSDSSHYMLVGTYSGLAAKIPSQNDYFGTESTGMFTTCIHDRQQLYMNYYNFMEFKNLRAGASARDFYKLQKKKDRESNEYSLNYEILMHEPELHDTTLVVMLEAFYPEFRTVSDISYDYWGRPVTHTYNVFDGYRFFNSMLTGISPHGVLLWDNSLEINLKPTMVLDNKADYFFDGEPYILFYNDGTKIDYRICIDNTELEPFTAMNLETPKAGDKITAVGINRLAHWYGYYFLAYGYETIQNNLVSGKNERTVFYINKISLE